MGLYVREIAGWILLLLGSALFGLVTYVLLLRRELLEAVPLLVVGIFVFRGGLQLLKIALAARIALQLRAAPLERPRQAPGRRIPVDDWE